MARWYRRYRRSSYRRTRKHWSPTTQVVNTQTSSGSQKSLPIAFNRTGERVGTSYPIGPIMKVKYFRLNVVFESSVTALWALVYVPDGLPIGRLNVAGSQVDSVPGALYEPQQFIIASGVYTSQGSSGASAPLRVWSLARNLNPGDGVFLVWQTLTSASSIPTIITINYSSCRTKIKSAGLSMTIPNQAPSGVWGSKKERSRSDSGAHPPACQGVAGPTQREYCAAVLPQLRPLDLRPPQKNKPSKSWGASITPNFEGLGFPRGSKVKRACEVERLGLNRKKNGEMVPQVSPIELSPNQEALESTTQSREHPNVESYTDPDRS